MSESPSDSPASARYDVVGFGAHPDDLEHGMGGTLIKLARDGLRILLVHASRGEGGSHGDSENRVREATEAARFLGADLRFLDFEDLNIRDTTEARRAVVRVLRQARPHIVFAPYYDFPHMHPDHEELGKIVRGSTRLTRIRKFAPDLEPHDVKHFFYYILPQAVRPSFLIDVSDWIDQWRRLAECYGSQLDGLEGYYDLLLAFRRQYGMLIGRPYAEAFYSDRPVDLTAVDFRALDHEREKSHY